MKKKIDFKILAIALVLASLVSTVSFVLWVLLVRVGYAKLPSFVQLGIELASVLPNLPGLFAVSMSTLLYEDIFGFYDRSSKAMHVAFQVIHFCGLLPPWTLFFYIMLSLRKLKVR